MIIIGLIKLMLRCWCGWTIIHQNLLTLRWGNFVVNHIWMWKNYQIL